MGGGCSAITGNIREKINMCNLGFLSIQGWGSAMCKTKKKEKNRESEREKESQLSCISQDLATLPHVLHCIPFSWNCIRTRPVPTILHGIAQLLPNNCTSGHCAQPSSESWPYLRSGWCSAPTAGPGSRSSQWSSGNAPVVGGGEKERGVVSE